MRIPFAILLGVAFVMLAFQPAPAPMTVADCLLASEFSRGVPDTPVTTLVGVPAWAGGNGERVLTDGEQVGSASLYDSDGARRRVWFYAYGGSVFAFVFKHPNDPARRLPGEAEEVQHGDCLLRLSGG